MFMATMVRVRCLPAALGATTLVLMLAAGCAKSSLEVVPVHGKVTYKGQPLTEGTVNFEPVSAAQGQTRRPAVGMIQSDGTYQLSSFSPNDGAVPGEYRVTIRCVTGGPSPENPTAVEEWKIPKKYGDLEKSGLAASVPADAKPPLEINFDLTD